MREEDWRPLLIQVLQVMLSRSSAVWASVRGALSQAQPIISHSEPVAVCILCVSSNRFVFYVHIHPCLCSDTSYFFVCGLDDLFPALRATSPQYLGPCSGGGSD